MYLDILARQKDFKKILAVVGGKVGDLFKLVDEKLTYQVDRFN
jgi:hypothetical protein